MKTQPISTLTFSLVGFLVVNIVVLILAVGADIYSWDEYSNLDEWVDVNETLLESDLLVLATGSIQLLVIVVLAILFLCWVYRISKNLHTLAGVPMRYSPGWAVGWYFVPIAHLFMPYKVMKEIWNVAHKGRPSETWILVTWWTFWIVSMILGRFSMMFAFRAEDARGYAISGMADAVSDGFDIILTVVAILLVTTLSKAYRTNYEVEPLVIGERPAE